MDGNFCPSLSFVERKLCLSLVFIFVHGVSFFFKKGPNVLFHFSIYLKNEMKLRVNKFMKCNYLI